MRCKPIPPTSACASWTHSMLVYRVRTPSVSSRTVVAVSNGGCACVAPLAICPQRVLLADHVSSCPTRKLCCVPKSRLLPMRHWLSRLPSGRPTMALPLARGQSGVRCAALGTREKKDSDRRRTRSLGTRPVCPPANHTGCHPTGGAGRVWQQSGYAAHVCLGTDW